MDSHDLDYCSAFGVTFARLTAREVQDVLAEYDIYISDAVEDAKFYEGWRPVSVLEFYGAEYQDILADRDVV